MAAELDFQLSPAEARRWWCSRLRCVAICFLGKHPLDPPWCCRSRGSCQRGRWGTSTVRTRAAPATCARGLQPSSLVLTAAFPGAAAGTVSTAQALIAACFAAGLGHGPHAADSATLFVWLGADIRRVDVASGRETERGFLCGGDEGALALLPLPIACERRDSAA